MPTLIRTDRAAWKAWDLENSPPLPDQYLALVTPVDAWPGWWLEMRCNCRHARWISINSIANHSRGMLLTHVVCRLTCTKCGSAPSSVVLCSTNGHALHKNDVRIKLR